MRSRSPSPDQVALAGLAVWVGLVALQHLTTPGLPPGDHFISEYANADATGFLQVLAFAAWAVCHAACAVIAWRLRGDRALARGLLTGLLVLAAVGTLVAAVFATQTIGGELPAGESRSFAGRAHDTGTLGIFIGLIAGALVSTRLISAPRWYRPAVAGLALALVVVVPVMAALGLDAPGIGQRAFVLLGCGWQLAFIVAARGAG